MKRLQQWFDLLAGISPNEQARLERARAIFGIREAICVPMKGRHETLGVLYLDTHSSPRTAVVTRMK